MEETISTIVKHKETDDLNVEDIVRVVGNHNNLRQCVFQKALKGNLWVVVKMCLLLL
jgi:hypothetical protein